MDNVLGYHVFDGQLWLAYDEKTWTHGFKAAASFTSANLAHDIGKRESPDGTFYVLACLASR